MSAAELREAAALMRSRAEKATGVTHHWDALPAGVGVARVFCGQVFIAKTDETLGGGGSNAEHIASWHPAVALAVADWLDAEATALDAMAGFTGIVGAIEGPVTVKGAALSMVKAADGTVQFTADTSGPALVVARAYLGITP